MKQPMEILLDQVAWEAFKNPAISADELYATHHGILHIGEFEIRVFQLNTGQRIILKEDMEKFFGVSMEELLGVR